jgi:hypothetical protein
VQKEFDDLAKAFATGMSRRTAIKRFGLAALGVAFAGLAPGRAAARATTICGQTPPTCKSFCDWLYGKGSKAYFSCIDSGACHSGPCYEFGPQSPDCHHSVCPVNTVCVSLSINSNASLGGTRRYYCQPI